MRARSALAVLLLVATHALGAQTPAQRIIALAPNLTELTFAAGAGERLVGVVEYSDFPAAAVHIPRIGDAFRVDLERVLELQPDLVLAWEPGTPVQMIERLRSLGLNVVSVRTRRLADIGDAVREIGRRAGTLEAAEANAAQFEARIARLREQYRGGRELRVFVQVNERPVYTINGSHIITQVLQLCGGRNVFADLNELAPTVSIEAVIVANPDVILAASDGKHDPAAQWRRWKHIGAVRAGRVHNVPADHLNRATPRLAEGAEQICALLDQARGRVAR